MKLEELEELAKAGKLTIHKYNVGKSIRNRYIYGTKHTSEDVMRDEFYKIKEVKKISYTRYYYSARADDMESHQSYKITSKDYKILLKAGAKEEKE